MTRKVSKVLGGVEDLLLGNKEVMQVRGNKEVKVTGISGDSIPYGKGDNSILKEIELNQEAFSRLNIKQVIINNELTAVKTRLETAENTIRSLSDRIQTLEFNP